MSDEEKPSPPGSPVRHDEPTGGRPGGHDDDASGGRAANKSAEDAGGHTIPLEQEQPAPEEGSTDEVQKENAETSLDQPSQ